MSERTTHTVQMGLILAVATALILFGHDYISPVVVFTSMIASLAGVVGARIASNGYIKPGTGPLPQLPARGPSTPIPQSLIDTHPKMQTVASNSQGSMN